MANSTCKCNRILERSFFRYFHPLSGDGMHELQGFGMEIEAVGRLSVKGIAHDGAVHSVRMGGVDTELVGAAGLGIVGNAGAVSRVIQSEAKNLVYINVGVCVVVFEILPPFGRLDDI